MGFIANHHLLCNCAPASSRIDIVDRFFFAARPQHLGARPPSQLKPIDFQPNAIWCTIGSLVVVFPPDRNGCTVKREILSFTEMNLSGLHTANGACGKSYPLRISCYRRVRGNRAENSTVNEIIRGTGNDRVVFQSLVLPVSCKNQS